MQRVSLLHELVERKAQKTPDRHAFRFLDDSLSFAGLAEKSEQLACTLYAHGVVKGDRVGVFMHKSLEMPIAVYGIMRAGAAFVPIDPAASPQRLSEILVRYGIKHLVTQNNKRSVIEAALTTGAKLLSVIGLQEPGPANLRCRDWDSLADAPAREPVRIVGQDIAYIISTSGSTGVPKGILHTHASGLAYARMATELYEVSAADRLANHSSLHFDMATFEFFGGPMTGATVVLIPEPYTRLPASLSELMEQERITIWYSVPFALIQLLHYGALKKRDLASLRLVMFGGEPYHPKHLNALMRLWPGVRFSNVFGPAETNQCTFHHLDHPLDEDAETVPIGTMCRDADGLILNDDDTPTRRGDVGELVVRSQALMRGYWDDPKRNAECFFHRDLCAGISEAYYRTGDLVRWNGDVMVFLGRKDRQIKIRGFRIELDEIETILTKHSAVEMAAAYVCDDGEAIGAEVTLHNAVDATEEQLASFCRDRLPAYALPQYVRIIEAFPLTATQKIDRNALRARIGKTGVTELET